MDAATHNHLSMRFEMLEHSVGIDREHSSSDKADRIDIHSSACGEPLKTLQTQRAADRMSVVFRFATDGESKNPDNVREPGVICRGKVLSFAYFSLHEQRKVGRAPARKPLPASPKKIETLSTQNFRCIHHPDVER
jgi:hypothetical protein